MSDNSLFLIGLLCLIAAIVGGGLNAFGFQVPLFASLLRQVLLGGLGIGLMVVSGGPTGTTPATQLQAAQAAPPPEVPAASAASTASVASTDAAPETVTRPRPPAAIEVNWTAQPAEEFAAGRQVNCPCVAFEGVGRGSFDNMPSTVRVRNTCPGESQIAMARMTRSGQEFTHVRLPTGEQVELDVGQAAGYSALVSACGS